MVLQMGIPENPAKHALYKSGNNNADLAVSWYFENMGDESINLPLRVKKQGAGGAQKGGNDVPQDAIDMMAAMGFPEKKIIKALKNCDLNVERATDWLFSHMDDPDSDGDGDSVMQAEDQGDVYSCDKPGVYRLSSFVTHLGASVHAGHYVAHVYKQIDEGNPEKKWVYFNDAKVAHTDDPPIGKGYMYFFSKL